MSCLIDRASSKIAFISSIEGGMDIEKIASENPNKIVTHKIDYSKGHIHRTPDTDQRVQNPYRPMSIVVDCYK